MSKLIQSQLTDFLVKHNFANPVLIKFSENLAGSVYCVQEENGRRTTIKLINSKKLEELYQLSENNFINYIKLHIYYVSQFANKVACPRLVLINGSFVQLYEDMMFYMMKFIPGSDKEAGSISLQQKEQVANALSIIHETDLSSFDKRMFNIKAHYFANAWQTFVDGSGLELIKNLAKGYLNYDLNRFIKNISKAVTYDSIIQLSKCNTTVMTHSDLKPKNVIWNTDDRFFIIDWDELCLLRAETDFIDTLTSWAVQKNPNFYSLDLVTAKAFRAAYKRSLVFDDIDAYISAAKWMFWVMTCHCMKNEQMLVDGLLMLQMLDIHFEQMLTL